MKLNRYFFLPLIGLLFSVFSLQAQMSEGYIQYEYRLDVHRNIPADREDLKKMIPQHRIENFYLFFTPAASLYKNAEDPNDALNRGPGGGRGMMRSPKTETFTDKAAREITVMQEFLGKNYLITENLDLAPWKMGNEFMDIAGYICHMAYYTDTIAKQEITAWFTVQIQPFVGPDRYSTLPGTILALDINNGERVWVARKVEARPVQAAEIRKPQRGDKITREAFNKMMDEQIERMGGRAGSFRF